MSNWQLYQSFMDINKKLWTKLEMARRRNQILSTSETNLYFANIMLIAFCVQPPAIFLHSAGKFPSCCLCGNKVISRHVLIIFLHNNSNSNVLGMVAICDLDNRVTLELVKTQYTRDDKTWFPYGRKHVVTVVEIDSFSISMTFTTLLRHIHDHMETRLKESYFYANHSMTIEP